MRYAAIIANGGAAALMIWLISTNGFGESPVEWAMAAVLAAAPVLALCALIRRPSPEKVGLSRWMALWFERKAHEERAKIAALKRVP